MLAECLGELEREQVGSACPVVDHEVVRAAAEFPENARVWLVCRTRAEHREFADTQFARARSSLQRKLLGRGFPEAALASLTILVTSREELAAQGGRFPPAP